MTEAAGIIFQVKDGGSILLLQRSVAGDHPGEWCFPGGTLEAGEAAETAAVREVAEELGIDADGLSSPPRKLHARTQMDGVDYTTFRQVVAEPFLPTLNAENTAYAWAKPDALPQPMHTGAAIAAAKLGWHETEIAAAIRDGSLTSPQFLENMALFALRITGTGASYRSGHKEYVWRNPSIYLNDNFLARCNGLPVIIEHPEKNQMMSSADFHERVIGSIVMPYIQNDEVWGIARIYDTAAIVMMANNQLSTSPNVVFIDLSVNLKSELDDGSVLLIEGEPRLLDHLAVCEQGVWDKGGAPVGVQTTAKDTIMAETEKAAEAVKSDAADPIMSKLDAIMGKCDSLTSRMDAFDKSRKDAEELTAAEKAKAALEEDTKREAEAKKDAFDPEKLKADKARRDADETKEKEAKERVDSARKDADTLRARLDQIEQSMPKARTDADYAAMADAQAKADRVHSAFGDSAPRPLQGEDLLSYRRRLVIGLQGHSAPWKGIDLSQVPADVIQVAEAQIYADAVAVARNPVGVPEGTLREVIDIDRTGRKISSFVGDPMAWMDQFASKRRRLEKINTSSKGA